MELNIQAIADAKIKSMHESGEIQKRIEDDVQKLVVGAIDSALNGYQIRSDVEKAVSASVSTVLKDVDFTTYNGFIAQKVKEITEGVLMQDVQEKISKVFSEMLIVKHDGIKLSEIFSAYREWVCESTEEGDKWEYHHFVCDIEEHESGDFTHYTIRFNEKAISKYDSAQIEFGFCTYMDKTKSSISRLSLDGKSMDGSFVIGRLNEMQSLLANLYFNKTEIILDFDDVDDSNHYDIDD